MEEINEQIKIIRSYLNEDEINQDIVEVDNVNLINYLEEIGPQGIQYETKQVHQFGKFTELGGSTDLWYKDMNGVWIIKNWQINRLDK